MERKLIPGVSFNGGWTLIDIHHTTDEGIVIPKRAIVLAVVQDDSGSIRDRFVTWDMWYDDLSLSCSWGHYHEKFEDAVVDYRKRLEKHLQDRQEIRAIRSRGKDDGKAAASWLIDGNTPHPEEVLDRLIDGIDEGDPAILDELPSPRLGAEFADDPTWEDILKAELDEYSEERVFNGEYDDLYEAYQYAFQNGVEEWLRETIKSYR
jgi:hypothetical protein